MKSMITLILLLFSVSVHADPPPVVKSMTFKALSDAQVLQIKLRTATAVNCPNQLDLKYEVNNGIITVKYNEDAYAAINDLANNVSKECSKEILDHQFGKTSGEVCLSIGFENGSVYLPTPILPQGQEEYIINYPHFLNVVGIVEYK